MSEFSIIVSIPSDGLAHTVTVNTNTPFSAKRIRGVYADYAGTSGLVEYDEFATVGIRVAGCEVIPDNFPVRWISSGYWVRRDANEVLPNLRKENKWAELPMDEPAEGSKLEVTVTSRKSLVLIFRTDNHEVGKTRKRYKVVKVSPSGGWQRPTSLPSAAWENNLASNFQVDVGGVIKGVFCEYEVDYSGINAYPYLHQAGKWFYGVMPSGYAKRRAFQIPLDTDITSDSLAERDYVKNFLNLNTWLTIRTATGKEIANGINAGIVAPTRSISFKHAELRKDGDTEHVSIFAQFPFFFNQNSDLAPARNDLPFTRCELILCLTFSEKKQQ